MLVLAVLLDGTLLNVILSDVVAPREEIFDLICLDFDECLLARAKFDDIRINLFK
jgi:hypothetical protein